MAIVYYNIGSNIVAVYGTIVKFRVVERGPPYDLKVDLTNRYDCSPKTGYPKPGDKNYPMLLSYDYCKRNGIDMTGRQKDPPDLNIETPNGGWQSLADLEVESIMLRTKGEKPKELNICDPTMVHPSSIQIDGRCRVTIAISEAGAKQLGIDPDVLPPYEGPSELPGSPAREPRGVKDGPVRDLLMAIANLLG